MLEIKSMHQAMKSYSKKIEEITPVYEIMVDMFHIMKLIEIDAYGSK